MSRADVAYRRVRVTPLVVQFVVLLGYQAEKTEIYKKSGSTKSAPAQLFIQMKERVYFLIPNACTVSCVKDLQSEQPALHGFLNVGCNIMSMIYMRMFQKNSPCFPGKKDVSPSSVTRCGRLSETKTTSSGSGWRLTGIPAKLSVFTSVTEAERELGSCGTACLPFIGNALFVIQIFRMHIKRLCRSGGIKLLGKIENHIGEIRYFIHHYNASLALS